MAEMVSIETSVLERLAAGPPLLGSTHLVSIDGPAGSGKTTLARSVEAAACSAGHRAATLHMDDMYEGWTGMTPGLVTRVLAQVLVPLSHGVAARWQRYDWVAEGFAEWHDLAPPDVLVLEGCGSGSLAFAESTSVLVWVEAARDVRLARGVERDGEQMRAAWLTWLEHEAAWFVANRTRGRADEHLTTG